MPIKKFLSEQLSYSTRCDTKDLCDLLRSHQAFIHMDTSMEFIVPSTEAMSTILLVKIERSND
jgi:hypothetical protein